MNGRSFKPIIKYPEKPTEVFLVMHEQAYRPEGLEFDYMVGNLRENLNNNAYGRYLTEPGEIRARSIGTSLKQMKLKFIVTEDFATPRETARIIAEEAGGGKPIPVIFDDRVTESNLSYLSTTRFDELIQEEINGDINAVMRDWIINSTDDFETLIAKHIDLWNEYLIAKAGYKFVFVLHIEGILLFLVLLLGLKPETICSLHLSRSKPINIRLFLDRAPIISFGAINPCDAAFQQSIYSYY